MSKPDQAVETVGHEERHIQNVAVQLEIVKGKPNTEFDLIWEQFPEFIQASAADILSDLTSMG